MKCPKCGAENEEDAKFCKKCGKNLKNPSTFKKKNNKPKTLFRRKKTVDIFDSYINYCCGSLLGLYFLYE